MFSKQKKIFTPSKVASEHDKVEAYLKGERFYPTTMEIDLTQLCSRDCPGCPYGASRKPGLTLQLPFLDRLFGVLGPHTPGIVFSGGEPTIVPHFPETLKLARDRGFKEVAIISNGENIDKPKIREALLENATAIRISMYDWQEGESEHFIKTLKKIEKLRNLVEKTGSSLEIGASMLTRREINHRYEPVGLKALDSGIHWLYFHPYCIDWDKKYPKKADQTGVLDAIESLINSAPKDASIQVPYERYLDTKLHFEKLHGSYFLIQVGADGVNYAGPECKYEDEAKLLDLNEYMKDDFLWHPDRINKLNRINSANYRHIGTKHRPSIFSDYIQKVIDSRVSHTAVQNADETDESFSYPNII